MNALAIALRTEARKFRAGRATLAASALFLGGLIALSLTFVSGARTGNAIPAGLLSILGRGLLPGIGAVAVTVVVAQISVFAGAGPWIPLATPALWAIDPTSVPPAAWLLVPIVPVVGTALTALAWHRLQLDR